MIVFQQLHYLDLEGVTRLLGGGEAGIPVRAGVSDAWMVDYLAALATICFMLFLGAPRVPESEAIGAPRVPESEAIGVPRVPESEVLGASRVLEPDALRCAVVQPRGCTLHRHLPATHVWVRAQRPSKSRERSAVWVRV